MSVEMFDVLDAEGKLTGQQATKEEVFSRGLYRLVTHAWIINGRGQLLAQKRVMRKGLWDGLWDVTVGGGVSANEDSLHACVRELGEELSLDVNPESLIFAGRFKTSKPLPERGITAYEFSDTYIAIQDVDISKLVLQDAEVSAVALIPLEEAGKEGIGRLWVPHPADYYEAVIQKCRELL